MQWEGPLAVCLHIKRGVTVPIAVVHGLCALMWVMHVKGAPLSLDLNKREIGANGLAALARGMAPSLTTLLLDHSDSARRGGDAPLDQAWRHDLAEAPHLTTFLARDR